MKHYRLNESELIVKPTIRIVQVDNLRGEVAVHTSEYPFHSFKIKEFLDKFTPDEYKTGQTIKLDCEECDNGLTDTDIVMDRTCQCYTCKGTGQIEFKIKDLDLVQANKSWRFQKDQFEINLFDEKDEWVIKVTIEAV